MSETRYCPFCGSTELTEYDTGLSDFPVQCDRCNAGLAIDEAAGKLRTRRWDRQAARGVHEEFPLERLTTPPAEGQP